MKEKIIIAGVVLGIGAAIAGYDFYTFQTEKLPQMEADLRKYEGEVASKQGELRRLQAFAQNIENIKKELKELNLQLDSALEYMPRSFNLATLLRRLSLLAQNSGVSLYAFRPKKGEEKKEGTFYTSTTIDFDVKGTFTQTLVFLDQLSRLKRIVNVDSLKLKAMSDPTRDKSANLLIATNGVMRTYRFAE